MLRQYETTFIVDAHLPGEAIEASIEKYSQFVEANGGKVVSVDRWGKRRLAYEINKKQYGYYVCMRFDAEGEFVKALEREYKLDEQIIRYLTTVIPKLVLKEEALLRERGEAVPHLMPESDDDEGSSGETRRGNSDDDSEDME